MKTPRVRKNAKGKRVRSQTKQVVANVYEYFEEIHKCQRNQGSLKKFYKSFICQHQEATEKES